MTAPTPGQIANRVSDELYVRLDPGGDLCGRLEDLLTEVANDVMETVGLSTVDGFEPGAAEVFTDFGMAPGQIAQEIADLFYRRTRYYLESKEAEPVPA